MSQAPVLRAKVTLWFNVHSDQEGEVVLSGIVEYLGCVLSVLNDDADLSTALSYVQEGDANAQEE